MEDRCAEEAEILRAYCLAVRSALTDDGQPPLEAAGLQLLDRLQALDASIARVAEKRERAFELTRLQRVVRAGLLATEPLWAPIRQAYRWLYQAAHLLTNQEQRDGTSGQQAYEHLLSTMIQQQDLLGQRAPAVTHFCPRHPELLERPLSVLPGQGTASYQQ